MPTLTRPRPTTPDDAFRLLMQREMQRRGVSPHRRSPEDAALAQACEWDLEQFASTFFPQLCTVPFSAMHHEMFAHDLALKDARDLREATAAPRGSAKTTIRGFIKIIQDLVYGHERFTVIFSHTASLAEDRVKQIKEELESNAALCRVFGPQEGIVWNNADLITRNGARLKAASPGSQLRGILHRGTRVTKIVLDDFENPEHVLSELQRQKTSQRFFADIMKLGAPGTNVEVIGTILHPQSLLAELLTNPGFTRRKYQAVLRWPEASALPLWAQWRARYVELENPHRIADARAFFEAHQDAMLAGSAVLWPEREDYYTLMVMRLVEGDHSFFMEKMNSPLGSNQYLFDMEQAAYCTLVPNGILKAGGMLVAWSDITEVAMSYDPTPDKESIQDSDYAACCVLAKDRSGYYYVLDCYLAQEQSTKKQIEAIVDLAWKWDCHLLGVESNNFASLLIQDIREMVKQRALAERTPAFDLQMVAIVNMRDKVARIKTLEPLIANGWLQFNRTLPAEFFRQFREFLPLKDAGKDDALDAVEMSARVVNHMFERRDIT